MKINEIVCESKQKLYESPTDLVARYYALYPRDYDDFNIEANEYAKDTEEYYKTFFDPDVDSTPIFSEQSNFDESKNELWRNFPMYDEEQSPGYRGLQYAKSRSKMNYDHEVQPPPGNRVPLQIDDTI